MHKVIHLLPYDGIGGAEAAARSMASAGLTDIDFEVRFLFPDVTSRKDRARTFNPLSLLGGVRAILRERPDLLIVSLWRSCIAGILVKLARPRTRLVVLLHNSVDAHVADRLATRWAMRFAEAVWADSEASVRLRFRQPPRAPVTVIPFLTHHLHPAVSAGETPAPTADFIFWGRLAAQKNLRRAFEIFRNVHLVHPGARFTVIGPDSGELGMLREWCAMHGIGDAVMFPGPMSFESIAAEAARHCFYLQTSDYEGMAMAVVEAMQLGLVPVVTPVGEIERYCRDGVNAIVVGDADEASAKVLAMIADTKDWKARRQEALATWRGQPLYRDAVAAECRRLLASQGR